MAGYSLHTLNWVSLTGQWMWGARCLRFRHEISHALNDDVLGKLTNTDFYSNSREFKDALITDVAAATVSNDQAAIKAISAYLNPTDPKTGLQSEDVAVKLMTELEMICLC
jgi:hypothetical protein